MSHDPFADPVAMAPPHSVMGEATERRRDVPGWGVALIVIGGVMIGGFFASLGAAVAIPVALSYQQETVGGAEIIAASPAPATPSPTPSESASPEAAPSTSAAPRPSQTFEGFERMEPVVFGRSQWQLTPLPSWEPIADTADLEAYVSAMAASYASVDVDLVGAWNTRGRDDELVYVIHLTSNGPPTDGDFQAFLDTEVEALRASGLDVTPSPIDWYQSTAADTLEATMPIEISKDGDVVYEVFTLKRLGNSFAVGTAVSANENAAIMAAWGVRDSLEAVPPAH